MRGGAVHDDRPPARDNGDPALRRHIDCLERDKVQWRRELDAAQSALAEMKQAQSALLAEHLEVERDLHRVLAQSEQMLAAISSILIGVNARGQITAWNMAARRTFGPAATEVLDRPFSECGATWDWDRVQSAVEACRDTSQVQRLEDVSYRRDDGREGLLGLTLNPVREYAEDQEYAEDAVGFLLLATDVTERRALQAQLVQAQKLESIGQLAAGVAHEINTPIQYIGDNIRFFRDSLHDLHPLLCGYRDFVRTCATGVTPEAVHEIVAAEAAADLDYLLEEIPRAIDQSLEGVKRVAHIVQAMKEFSHPGTGAKTLVDLNHALESTLTIACNEWRYVAGLVTQFDPSLPPVPCLAGEMNQVFLNLIVNAAHAIGEVVGERDSKGTITVRTRAGDGCAEIHIQDTGGGIPEAIRPRIFDPFFTTKKIGKGTGQGLAIAHAVVEKHGGTITFESVRGSGTTFVIRLPLGAAMEEGGE